MVELHQAEEVMEPLKVIISNTKKTTDVGEALSELEVYYKRRHLLDKTAIEELTEALDSFVQALSDEIDTMFDVYCSSRSRLLQVLLSARSAGADQGNS